MEYTGKIYNNKYCTTDISHLISHNARKKEVVVVPVAPPVEEEVPAAEEEVHPVEE